MFQFLGKDVFEIILSGFICFNFEA